jgi:hypothetical protein
MGDGLTNDFDLDRDPLALPRGANGALRRAEVDVKIAPAERERQRIVRDLPAIRDQGADNGVMVEVTCGHLRRPEPVDREG